MNLLPTSIVFTLTLVFFSCLGGHKHDPVLTEAFEVHKQSLAMAKEVRSRLDNISNTDSSRIHLESRLAQWNENIIEVPGFEHHHEHGHDHHHHHNHSSLELMPTDMLNVQNEFLDSIKVILTDIKSIGQD